MANAVLQHASQHSQIPKGSQGGNGWAHESTWQSLSPLQRWCPVQSPEHGGMALGTDVRITEQATSPVWQL